MKITYKSYNAVAAWQWTVRNKPSASSSSAGARAEAVHPESDSDSSSDSDSDSNSNSPSHPKEEIDQEDLARVKVEKRKRRAEREKREKEREEEEEEEEEDFCAICSLEYESACPQCKVPGDDCPLIWGECTHVFHMHCLLKWLQTPSSKEQCPLDRRPWSTADRAIPDGHSHVNEVIPT